MQKQRGQIQIILLVIAIIGIILFINFFKGKGNPEIKPAVLPSQEESVVPSPKPKPTPNSSPVPDSAAPYRFNPAPVQGLSSDTRQVLISLNTDENATCRYSTVSGFFYEYMQDTFSKTGGPFHSTLITGLNEGGVYNYYVRCVDGQGNKNSDDFVIAFWVNYPIDLTPPILSRAYPSGDILPVGTFETMIGVSTNEPASCRYSRGQGTVYDSMGNSLSPDGIKQYHTAVISGLSPGQTYNYFVRCKDLSGNVNTGDVMISFRVAP